MITFDCVEIACAPSFQWCSCLLYAQISKTKIIYKDLRENGFLVTKHIFGSKYAIFE